jgi:predicted nucleotidyltransferase
VIPAEIRPQLARLVEGLGRILGSDLVGVYLHGSAVLGCFGPRSDIDLVAVAARPTPEQDKQALMAVLLEESVPYDHPGGRRPIELDLVLASALRPWQYPATLDFHYSEEFRARFEATGELDAWESLESRDLAAHITVLRRSGQAVSGPPIDSVFPEVPTANYVDALTHDLWWCREQWVQRPHYGVLSIARIWATLATGEPQSKATGANWALPRLPAELRPVLEHGLAVYTDANERDGWDELPVSDYLECVATEIDAVS